MLNNSKNASVCDDVLIAIRRIIQSIDLHSKSLVKEFGLTGPQLIILKEISHTSEITPSELSKAISLSQATITGILNRLEKKGLIARRRSVIDRRRLPVEITPSGDLLLENAPPLMQEAFIRQFTEIESWEQHMILSSLNRLVSMMDAKQISAVPILTMDPLKPALTPVNNSSILS